LKLRPRHLTGQTIALLIVALLSAQVISALIIRGETRSFYKGAESRFLTERIYPFAALLRSTSPELQGKVADTLNSKRVQIWISDTPSSITKPTYGHDEDENLERAHELAERITEELGDLDTSRVHVVIRKHFRDSHDDHENKAWRISHAFKNAPRRAKRANVYISIELSDHRWMNAAVHTRPPRQLIRPDGWITFFIAALVISLIVVIALRRITKPLQRLSEVAGRLGRSETVAPLTPEGPADIRDTIHAFNEMQHRLHKFVQDRTNMLAAIRHDLRTPITSLRLRAEMLKNKEARDQMIATLHVMQQMVEATLAFAREEASDEPTRPSDLNALLTAITDDLGGLGLDATCITNERIVYPCRPTSLRRAFSNLIQNAATYGKHARVSLTTAENNDNQIIIDDDGPGIPTAEHERVFEPFVHLEGSRSSKTGGVGLGMAIARDSILRHGGQIHLSNRDGGGLSVTVLLPAVLAET